MIKKTVLLTFILSVFSSLTFAQSTLKSADGQSVTITDTSRIITIGGSITATVFALGAGNQVIAVDESSTYPRDVHSLPKVPYLRQLSAEGILSLNPSLILADEAASPKTAIQQLRQANVPVLLIPNEASIEGAVTKIKRLAKALDKQEKGQQLITALQNKINKAKKLQKQAAGHSTEVMFILSLGKGSPVIAGNHTEADKAIKLAGGTNVFHSFSGYKPVSAGAISAANPDVILMMGNRFEGANPAESAKQATGISLTKAAKNGRIYVYDGNYLLGFGPRTGDALLKLVHVFYPNLAK